MKRYTSLMKGDNTYLGLQSLQPWSVYGDSNSFLMLNMREEKDCQKVAPFLQNLPTFKKRTHYFWDSKVTGAFPGGLCAKVLLYICLVQLSGMPTPKFLSELVNCAQNEEEICKKCHGHLLHRSGLTLVSINELPGTPIWPISVWFWWNSVGREISISLKHG